MATESAQYYLLLEQWKKHLVKAGLDEPFAQKYGSILAGLGAPTDYTFMASLSHTNLQSYGVCVTNFQVFSSYSIKG